MLLGLGFLFLGDVIDAYFVGRLGSEALSALAFTIPVKLLLANLGAGMSVGTLSLGARALGADDTDRAYALIRHGLGLSLAIGVIVAVLALMFIEPLFALLGATPAVIELIRDYMSVWYLGLPILLVALVGGGALRAMGDTRTPAIVQSAAMALHIVLDVILIFGAGPVPALGLVGAAWAFVVARLFVATMFMWMLARGGALRLGHGIALPRLRPMFDSGRQIARIAVPAMAGRLVFPLAMVALTRMLAVHGPEVVAALGVGSRIENLGMTAVTALCTGLMPFVGQNWGAGRIDRVRESVRLSIYFSLLWGAVVGVGFLLAAPTIAGWFSDGPEVTAAIARYLQILAPSLGLQGVAALVAAMFNAVGWPLRATAITVLRMFVLYLPLAWLGSQAWGPTGVFIGGAAAGILAGFAALFWSRHSLRAGRSDIP